MPFYSVHDMSIHEEGRGGVQWCGHKNLGRLHFTLKMSSLVSNYQLRVRLKVVHRRTSFLCEKIERAKRGVRERAITVYKIHVSFHKFLELQGSSK